MSISHREGCRRALAHLDEVQKLLEEDHYMYYQPVAEAFEAVLILLKTNHKPAAISFARACAKEALEILLAQSPASVSQANLKNTERIITSGINLCVEFLVAQDLSLMPVFMLILDSRQCFYSGPHPSTTETAHTTGFRETHGHIGGT
jgi:hypothetical protein